VAREHEHPEASRQKASLLLFALDEKAAALAEKQFHEIIAKAKADVTVNKDFVPAYVGEFVGYCFSVVLGVVSNAVYDVCLKLLRSAQRAKRGVPWISFELAEAVVREDLTKRLKISTFERVQAIDLESQSYPISDITALFHLPDKGYIFLVREPNGKKHYYEISTDGRVMCYRRYARNRKSLIELVQRR